MSSNARYVPPLVEDLDDCLADLEMFINNDSLKVPELVKIAIIHYQFESIHPFLDGNGRIGRLLIPLYLQEKKYLDNPCLYISFFFEKNRNIYYEMLDGVRINNDMKGWIKFFLQGIIETSKISKEKLKKVVELTKKIDIKIASLKVMYDNAKKVIDYFYDNPISSRKKIIEKIDMPISTLNGVLNELQKVGILREITGFSRNKSFAFQEYIDIFLNQD